MTSWIQALLNPLNPDAAPEPAGEVYPTDLRIRPTEAEEAVERAWSDVGRPSRYRLGGGADALEYPASPFDEDGTSDCSGATGHWTGHERIQVVDGKRISYYTDNIIRDMHRFGHTGRDNWMMRGGITGPGPRVMYEPTAGEDDVLGCLLVTPGHYVAGRRVRIGHVRIIVAVLPGFRRGQGRWWERLLVVHCTPNRGRDSAVRVGLAGTGPNPAVARASYIARPRWYV